MFNVLLVLLGFVTVETNRKNLLCDTPKMEAFYEMCDDSFAPVIKVEPCDMSKKAFINFTATIIPRKNIDRLYSRVEIWKESWSVSDYRYDVCSGVDDEFDFCGALKGETVTVSYYGRYFKKVQLFKGLYTVKVQLVVGEKEELLSCALMTLNVKASLV